MTSTLKSRRPREIEAAYVALIDRHLDDLMHQRVSEMMEIEEFAKQLFIHPTHLSNTIKDLTGISPCGIYQAKILNIAQALLAKENLNIRDVALLLTYEPSQFTKWFKRVQGVTPKQYRLQILKS